MEIDIQKASIWKRAAAWMLDTILVCVLAMGAATLLGWLLGYPAHAQALDDAYVRYESQYGIQFNIDAESYEKLTPEQRKNYDDAYAALIADEAVIADYNTVLNQSLLIVTFSLLVGILAADFGAPMLLGGGQTLGKRVFSLSLVRTDCVKVNTLQLFTRTVLGKYTLETMIPVYLLIMTFFGNMGSLGLTLLGIAALVQLILPLVNRNNALLHDLLAGTVVVDASSQHIFTSPEELMAYTKRIHAERAARQPY